MKKIKIAVLLIIILIVAIVGILIFTQDKVVNGDVVLDKICDMYLSNDISKVNDIEIDEEKAKKVLDKQERRIRNQYNQYFKSFNISDNKINELTKAEIEILKNIKIENELVSEDDQIQVLKIKSNYYKMQDLMIKLREESMKEVKDSNLSQEEYDDKVVNIYVDKLIDEIKKMKPSEDNKEILVTFNKKEYIEDDKVKYIFMPDNIDSLVLNIQKLIIN